MNSAIHIVCETVIVHLECLMCASVCMNKLFEDVEASCVYKLHV